MTMDLYLSCWLRSLSVGVVVVGSVVGCSIFVGVCGGVGAGLTHTYVFLTCRDRDWCWGAWVLVRSIRIRPPPHLIGVTPDKTQYLTKKYPVKNPTVEKYVYSTGF